MQWNLNDNSPSWEREGVCLKKKALCKRTYLQGRCGAYINLTLGPNWMAAGSSHGHRADPRQALAELGEKGQSLQSNGKAVSRGEESSTLPKHAHLWRMGPSTQLARKAASLGDLSCSERRSETTICASLRSERYAYTSSISPLKCRSPAHVIASWKTQEELFFLSRKKKHMFLGLCKNNQDKSSHKEKKKQRKPLFSLLMQSYQTSSLHRVTFPDGWSWKRETSYANFMDWHSELLFGASPKEGESKCNQIL